MQKRIFSVCDLRNDQIDGRPVIRGRAIVFNSETMIGPFREVVRPGALTKTLAERDQVALWNHDTGKPLGRTSANTLMLDEGPDGLDALIFPGTRSWDLDAIQSIERGDVRGMSFGFDVIKDNIIREEGKPPLVELREISLWEVSPVTFPAYGDTSVAIRSAVDWYTQRFTEPSGDLDLLQRTLLLAQLGA